MNSSSSDNEFMTKYTIVNQGLRENPQQQFSVTFIKQGMVIHTKGQSTVSLQLNYLFASCMTYSEL